MIRLEFYKPGAEARLQVITQETLPPFSRWRGEGVVVVFRLGRFLAGGRSADQIQTRLQEMAKSVGEPAAFLRSIGRRRWKIDLDTLADRHIPSPPDWLTGVIEVEAELFPGSNSIEAILPKGDILVASGNSSESEIRQVDSEQVKAA